MPFAEFTDGLRVGHEEIDHQHATLFDAVNRLHVNRPVFLGQMVECIHAAAPAPRRS